MQEFEAEVRKKSETPIREISPVPVPGQYYVWGPIVSGLLSIVPGVFAFAFWNLFFPGPQGQFTATPGILGYVVSFVLLMRWMHRASYVNPSQTRYAIYRDRIESEKDGSTRSRCTVFYDKIVDVRMSQGSFQRPVNAGTILLMLQQASPGETSFNHAFSLSNIPDPSETYDLICSLARDSRRNS